MAEILMSLGGVNLVYRYADPASVMPTVPTPIYDALVVAFREMRRSTRPGGKCMWITYPNGTQRCLVCRDVIWEMEDE